MNDCGKANHSIECCVSNCANHCTTDNYCSLKAIKVGTHEPHPTMDQCTDCQSYALKAK